MRVATKLIFLTVNRLIQKTCEAVEAILVPG
jgi:hypothetical protein